MNKTELIKQMATISGLTQAQAGEALDALCTAVIDELGAGGEVSLMGFGTFSAPQRAERQGRNPKTGEPITIPARRTVKFKAGKMLRDSLTCHAAAAPHQATPPKKPPLPPPAKVRKPTSKAARCAPPQYAPIPAPAANGTPAILCFWHKVSSTAPRFDAQGGFLIW